MEVSVGAVPSIPGSPEREPWFARCLLQQLFDKSYLKKETETGVATLMILDKSSTKKYDNPLGLTTELIKSVSNTKLISRGSNRREAKAWRYGSAWQQTLLWWPLYRGLCPNVVLKAKLPSVWWSCPMMGVLEQVIFGCFWGWGKLHDINLTYSFYRWGFLHFRHLKFLVKRLLTLFLQHSPPRHPSYSIIAWVIPSADMKFPCLPKSSSHTFWGSVRSP